MILNDISRCSNQACPKKQQCQRFVAEVNRVAVTWYSDFQPNQKGECWHHIPLDANHTNTSYTPKQ